MVDMPVDVMDLVRHRVEYYCMADFNHGETYRVTVAIDNRIVSELLYFCNDGCEIPDDMAQWLNRVGRKVLSASRRGSAFTLVLGKDDDGTCFKVRVLPDMIRRC